MSKPTFTFSNLLGRGAPRAEDGAEDDDQAEAGTEAENEEDDTEATEETSETAEGDGPKEDDEDGTDEDQAAFARGRAAERARIAGILGHASVNAGNIAQAVQLACNTDLTPEQAASVLGAAPQGGVLSAAMNQRQTLLKTPGAGGGGSSKVSLKERAAARRGRKN